MPNAIAKTNFTIVGAGESPTATGDAAAAVQDRAVRPDDLEVSGASAEFLKAAGFKGELAQTLMLPQGQTAVIAVGLGPDPLTEPALRNAAAQVLRTAKRMDSLVTSLAVAAADELGSATAVSAVVEAMMLASYRFDECKGEHAKGDADSSRADSSSAESGGTDSSSADSNGQALREIFIVTPADLSAHEAQAAIDRAGAVADAIALARDLVNRPAGGLTPTQLAQAAVEAMPTAAELGADGGSVAVEVWDKERLAQERCGGLLGVNAGSTEEPRLVRIAYNPAAEPTAVIYLIGKGITFDTGGLNLKSFEGMQTMKTDMGGAATVIGAMAALTRLAPTAAVVGICCCTDNQPGPTATKPGDVLHIRNGTTVEVLNTDAEGRLVLADGLAIAAESSPSLIVDVATLTGACVVALGTKYAGLMSNSDSAVAGVKSAAQAAGELVWHLPLPTEYRSQLDSEVADLRNIGKGRYGGALTAGLFLKEFVGTNDWVHLDIAGPVTTDTEQGELAKGATGFGVRTLVNLVADFDTPGPV